MSTRTYTITIHVSRKNAFSGIFTDVPYPGKPDHKSGDSIRYLKQKIVIVAIRAVNPKDDDILENRTNSLHTQIIKSLLYLYVANQKRIYVRSIEIKKGKAPSTIYELERDTQPIKGDFFITRALLQNVLDIIFEETAAAKKLRVILTQLLSGMGGVDRYYKFERFWRSYEQLCIWHKYHGAIPGGKPSEFDSIVEMRNYIISNPVVMTSSCRESSTLTYNDLNDNFLWYQYIVNEYTVPGTPATYGRYKNHFVGNYTDYRIMQLHQALLPYREDCLRTYGYLQDIKSHLTHYLTPPNIVTKNEEIVTFLCGKYSYFLRNKLFHGEVADYTFRFYSKIKEDHAIDILNRVLQATSEDLVMVFDVL